MDRRNSERLRQYEPNVRGRERLDYDEGYGHEDSQDYRGHSSLHIDADLRRQRECHEGARRQEHRGIQQRSHENGRYEPRSEVRDHPYDNDVRENKYQWDSGYDQYLCERRYGCGNDYEDCRHGGWDTEHGDFRQSHYSDFYEDRKRSAVIGYEHYNKELRDGAWKGGVGSRHGLIAGEPSDDLFDRQGRSEKYPRSGEVNDSPDRNHTAGGRRRLTRADADAAYARDYYQHHGDRCYTSVSNERGKSADAFDTYKDSWGEKCRTNERYEQNKKDSRYSRNGRPFVNAVDDHDELRDSSKFTDYYHGGRGEGYHRKATSNCEGYYREDGLADVRRHDKRRLSDERAPLHKSPSLEEQWRHADSYENEHYVYRNCAYEDDDGYHRERYSGGWDSSRRGRNNLSRDQHIRQEHNSREEDHFSYDEQRGAVGSLPRQSSEGYVNRRYKSEQMDEDHQEEPYCTDATSEPMQSSVLQHAGEYIPELVPTRPPIVRECSTTTPRRTPLTPTTFAPSGEANGNILHIPRGTESDLQHRMGPRRRTESLMTQGTQRFATMKNARRIAEEMGMEQATADARAEVEQAEELLEKYEGRVKRTTWARRNQLQRSPAQEGDKFDVWDLKSFKVMKKASELGRDIVTWLAMWSSSLKTIEGHFGTGVVSYFLFLRWLLLLNLLMFLMLLLFIIIPHSVLPAVLKTNETRPFVVNGTFDNPSALAFSAVGPSVPGLLSTMDSLLDSQGIKAVANRSGSTIQHCYQEYYERVAYQKKGGISSLQDFLQGTGWMELTALFSGSYLNSVDHIAGTSLGYNFPLAYVLTNVACFVLCLLLMVRYTTAGVRESLLMSEGTLHQYCNMVFASWDFCITDERTARLKHVSIVQELKSDLAEERRRAEISSWSRRKKIGLFVLRLMVNLFVVAAIVGSLFAVYHATSFSFQRQSQAQTTHKNLALVIQFVPSLVITSLNIVVPAIFSKLIRLENYSVAFQVKLTLLRTVFLRFTSIFVLLLSLYKQINCSPVREDNCLEGEGDCRKPMCWETAVGQQIYKLTVMDFIVGVTLVFVVECPRKLIVTRFQCKLSKIIGQQEFNIPNRVLDLVYSQTLCWLGTFYCPLLPAVTLIKYFIIFYVQKFTLMNNSAPSQTPYRSSRSNTFFVIALLLALFLAVIPFAYALVEIQPSLSCGPFQQYLYTWKVVPDLISSWSNHPWGWHVLKAINFFTSVGFGVPVVVVLVISIYYYYSLAAAHAHMEKVLKDKLVLEGKDKQFLLARITEAPQQQSSSTT